MIRIKVRTLFDITATGVTGHYKPTKDSHLTLNLWNHARNQQRNWETLTQLIGLRTQIASINKPMREQDSWIFEFEIEQEVFNDGSDPVGILKVDSAGVPMLTNLDNIPDIDDILIIEGPRQNIWFTAEPINNILEN